jgi:hypothetical protein
LAHLWEDLLDEMIALCIHVAKGAAEEDADFAGLEWCGGGVGGGHGVIGSADDRRLSLPRVVRCRW